MAKGGLIALAKTGAQMSLDRFVRSFLHSFHLSKARCTVVLCSGSNQVSRPALERPPLPARRDGYITLVRHLLDKVARVDG